MSSDAVVPLLQEILARLSVVESKLSIEKATVSGGTSAAAATAAAAAAPTVTAFDALLTSKVAPFVAAATKLGGDAGEGAAAVETVFKELRKIVALATQCKEPSQADHGKVFQGLTNAVKSVGAVQKRNEWEKHTKTLSEGIGCVNWILVKPAPGEFIESFIGGSDYWANNIRKEFRATNADQIAFCDTFKGLLQGLLAYVNANYKTGLQWNANGVNWSDYKEGASAAAAPVASVSAPAAAAPAASSSLSAFDAYVTEKLEPFVAASSKLGGDAAKGAQAVKETWQELRKIISLSTQSKEPSQADLPKVVADLSNKLKSFSSLVNRNEWERHTKTLSEGVGCVNWILVKPAPGEFIESFIGGSDYWANNIRKEFRTTNADQIAFCDTFKGLLQGLLAYVNANYKTGLQWNAKGGNWNEAAAAAPAPAASASAAAPAAAATSKPANPMGNLFSELNKEGAVTSGLKKVTKDMQTWRAEYKGGDAPVSAPAPVAKAPARSGPQPKGPPKFEFQSGANKWLVENQSAANGLVRVEIGDKKETVYIFGCVGATVEVIGKCKSIIVDTCSRTAVHFENVMASIEIVNSQRMQIHCRETVSAVAIDKTDGIVVHLPRSSLSTEVVASKSSEMNLSWLDEQGELIEKPIPEQYVHRIVDNAITVAVSDLYSH